MLNGRNHMVVTINSPAPVFYITAPSMMVLRLSKSPFPRGSIFLRKAVNRDYEYVLKVSTGRCYEPASR